MSKLLLLLLPLLYSVIRSGYLYLYDNDEFSHAQKVYLIAQGLLPYRDFFSIYTPIFHWLLSPFYQLTGFNFTALAFSRILMILLFLLRLGLGFWIIKKLTNFTIALLSLFFLLCDPFTAFSAMQIRPDNLMLTFYLLGLFFLLKNNWLWVGLFFSLSFLTSLKILPSLIIFLGFIVYYKNASKQLILGLLIPLFCFLAYFAFTGNLIPMFQQVFGDAPLTNKSLLYPLPPGNFYWPNPILFGFAGRPITFDYVWYLLILSFIGVYIAIFETTKTPVLKLLALTLITHWLLLFRVKSIFIQYYLPLSWLFALFSAIAVVNIYQRIKLKLLKPILLLSSILFCILLYSASFRANLWRSKIDWQSQKIGAQHIWSVIPDQEPTFPNYLFRLPGYPLTHGYFYGDIPQKILTRFGPVEKYLEEKQVKYLWLDDQYTQYLTASTKTYLRNHYSLLDPAYHIWLRKN